jgi:methylmalonyl-CoA/ethylmalonyl-CoA epimerase
MKSPLQPKQSNWPTWHIDHIGIAVSDLDKAIDHYQQTTGACPGQREALAEHGVEIAFIELPGSKIELLAPLDDQSMLARFIKKRGVGLHHICYRVENIHAELQRLRKSGYRLIDDTPRPGAGNTLIAFIHPLSCDGVLTEICEYSAS